MTFSQRLVHAARLDPHLYEEVESDRASMAQAAAVVMLSSLAGGLGILVPGAGLAGLFWGLMASLLGWIFWAAIIYLVGVKVLPAPQTSSSVTELMRAMGFASAPGLLRIFGLFAPVRTVVYVIAMFWMLAAMVVAVRQALDYESTSRAVVVCGLGWLVQIAITLFLLWLNGLLYMPAGI